MREPNWSHYLSDFHDHRAGITERAFEHARHPTHGSGCDWLIDALPDHLGRVLDVACGNAPLMARLPADTDYLGVDISAGELELAIHSNRGPVMWADVRDLPLPDQSFDTVVSSMGLMLVQPVDQAFAEQARVLRPGGTLAFLIPSVWPLRPRDLRPIWTVSSPARTWVDAATCQRTSRQASAPTCWTLRCPGFLMQVSVPASARRRRQAFGSPVTDASMVRMWTPGA